jgi:hypothetical protein
MFRPAVGYGSLYQVQRVKVATQSPRQELVKGCLSVSVFKVRNNCSFVMRVYTWRSYYTRFSRSLRSSIVRFSEMLCHQVRYIHSFVSEQGDVSIFGSFLRKLLPTYQIKHRYIAKDRNLYATDTTRKRRRSYGTHCMSSSTSSPSSSSLLLEGCSLLRCHAV